VFWQPCQVDFIAYPVGFYTSETIKPVREAGYIGEFPVNSGFTMFKDVTAIRRIPIFHYDRSISYVMPCQGLLSEIFS
jgi:hypothetical protein